MHWSAHFCATSASLSSQDNALIFVTPSALASWKIYSSDLGIIFFWVDMTAYQIIYAIQLMVWVPFGAFRYVSQPPIFCHRHRISLIHDPNYFCCIMSHLHLNTLYDDLYFAILPNHILCLISSSLLQTTMIFWDLHGVKMLYCGIMSFLSKYIYSEILKNML